MSIADAKIHLDEAAELLRMKAWRMDPRGSMEEISHFTIAEDLDRIDRAIGPKGESMFGKISDLIRGSYVEILAARAALEKVGDQK